MGRGCGDQTLHVAKPQTAAPEGASVLHTKLSFASEVAISNKEVNMKTHALSSSEKTKVRCSSAIIRKLVVSLFAAASFGFAYNSAKVNLFHA